MNFRKTMRMRIIIVEITLDEDDNFSSIEIRMREIVLRSMAMMTGRIGKNMGCGSTFVQILLLEYSFILK